MDAAATQALDLTWTFTLGLCPPVRFPAVATPARLLALGAGGLRRSRCASRSSGVFSVDDILLNGVSCRLGGIVSRRW